MSNSRREFLLSSTGVLLAAKAAAGEQTHAGPSSGALKPAAAAAGRSTAPAPGTPPAFGTAPPVGPDVTAATFVEAQKLVRIELSARERAQAAQNWRNSIAAIYERRTGPRKVDLQSDLAPYSTWNPLLPGAVAPDRSEHFVRSSSDPGPLPHADADIAFAPVWKLSRWIESKQLTSARLTEIYLQRIAKLDGRLRSIITLTPELARGQAKRADQEIAAGHYRGPLHGIPWGGKDLLDTAGIPTTYGAEPYRNRVPKSDAAVVRRLQESGAVLLAKLSLGALALNDVWFGGQTMNPWLLEEGASGSSAGPGAATAAALVAFSIGSETEGSIVGPTMRCGLTGLRPTFGRVPRTGAMTLSWSLDKLGPMTRSVEDTMLVLHAISGADAGDLASVTHPLRFDGSESISGLRVGYFPKWMDEEPATEVDRQALATLRQIGLQPVEVSLPDWPYGSLNAILFAESAAAFEELTLSHRADQLRMQVPDAWPNTFRQSRFVSAVDFVQADRFRRAVAQQMLKLFTQVDLLLVPSLRDEMLTIGNFTGHPSLTLRAGFISVSEARSDWAPDPAQPLPKFNPPRRVPHGVTLIGRHFEEGRIGRVGLALEQALKVSDQRPPDFQGSA
ncbi:MAG TPA: amidase [Steroidobacteraceae bacterium]|nr:amidase [Steroidobacteraceae bacterium]